VENFVNTFLGLSTEVFSVLDSIEAEMRDHEGCPRLDGVHSSVFPIRKVEYEARILKAAGLVCWETLHYQGYQIDFDASDLLVWIYFAKCNLIKSLSEKPRRGKEFLVYDAQGSMPLIVKFHRLGRTNIKHFRRARGHLKSLPRSFWFYVAALAAKRMFKVMNRFYSKVSLPKPVALTKYRVTIELVNGDLLNRVVFVNLVGCLEIILSVHLGIIHVSLSEYNIIIYNYIINKIDWPQAADLNHPDALKKSKRDVSDNLGFFGRKYKVRIALEEALNYVRTPATEACR
jgi:RIO kinase 2